jgi:DNA-binding winged helix-turn-helix (wHTH) protein
LGSRAFPIFAVLVRSAGELVTKRELIAHVWPDAIVEENKLQVHISAIRKALGTDRGLVKTSSGRGYRLAGDWTIRKESSPVDPVAPGPRRMPVHPFLTNVPAAGSELIGKKRCYAAPAGDFKRFQVRTARPAQAPALTRGQSKCPSISPRPEIAARFQDVRASTADESRANDLALSVGGSRRARQQSGQRICSTTRPSAVS